MALSNIQKKNLTKLRKWVKTQRTRQRIKSYPSFSYGVDERTNKIILRYSVNIVVGYDKRNDEPIYNRKKLNKYTLIPLNLFTNININRDYDFVLKEVRKYETLAHKNTMNFPYWVDEYTTCDFRYGKSVTSISLKTDLMVLKKYEKWLMKNHPDYLDIYQHCIDGKVIFEKYLIELKNTKTRFGNYPSNNTLSNDYRRIKGFFNWLAEKDNRFIYNMLKMKGWGQERNKEKLPPAIQENDFIVLIKWMDENKENKYEKHFIPILRMLLITGCRIGEIVSMKITDIDIDKKLWRFYSKSRWRTIKLDSETLWEEIKHLIVDNDGIKRIDKEYVFHLEYWRKPNKNGKGGGIKQNLNTHITRSGIQHKFKRVIIDLGLDDKLTPHSCRRWFITYMLEKTNGNVPLVSQMVGHSSWEMVYRYNRERLPKQRTTIDINEVKEEM